MEDWERDEIAWLMQSAKLSFVEAVESLADQRGGQQWLDEMRAKTLSHRTIISYGGKSAVLAEVMPTGRTEPGFVGHCKYCYRTHGNWWWMPEHEYPDRAVLCGYCEHVSLERYL